MLAGLIPRAGQPLELPPPRAGICAWRPTDTVPARLFAAALRSGHSAFPVFCVCLGRNAKSLAVEGMARCACLGRLLAVVASLHAVCFHPLPPGRSGGCVAPLSPSRTLGTRFDKISASCPPHAESRLSSLPN